MESLLLVLLLGLSATHPVSSVIRIRPETPVPRDWPCPSDPDIVPCICEADTNFNLNMDCSGAVDELELQRIFQAPFPFYDLQSFTIVQDINDLNNIRNLDSGVFADITFEIVNITGTKLQTISENVFLKSHDRLKHLALSGNLISEFPFETLSSFLKLETFHIDNNLISLLPNLDSNTLKDFNIDNNLNLKFEVDVFKNVPNLQSISMSNISLTDLPPGLFAMQRNLSTLTLNDNQLTELVENAIVPMNRRLNELSLVGNHISQVTHDAIHGLADNSRASFANNEIKTLEKSIWQGIFSQVAEKGIIDLKDNPLECGCDLKWLVVDNVDDYMHLLSRESACTSGEFVSDLNPDYFNKFCP
ncbi:oplophorus-luciferin 2-monooxygenase non-catalytic subunit-like [Penaeus japonicus]|uniref:oplophorus-luciferin 2-monooxygenase non-catalytic subunit-like n=1 Tax=Penaeus japonicus TaxID=27405 RepID=UPI001C70BE12|nr:oplophorus-luciferin 2-monooxygenase non-catalytic subunit-like [Penaeus japonicus]